MRNEPQNIGLKIDVLTPKLSCLVRFSQGCIGRGAGGGGSAPLVKILWQVGGAQPPLLLHKIAYNVNVCQLCNHQF